MRRQLTPHPGTSRKRHAAERIRALTGQGLGNAAIAGQFATEGFRTPRQHDRFHDGEIQHLIGRLGLRPRYSAGFTVLRRRQNSLPSGSASTCQDSSPVCLTSAFLAPSSRRRCSSSSWLRSTALTSK